MLVLCILTQAQVCFFCASALVRVRVHLGVRVHAWCARARARAVVCKLKDSSQCFILFRQQRSTTQVCRECASLRMHELVTRRDEGCDAMEGLDEPAMQASFGIAICLSTSLKCLVQETRLRVSSHHIRLSVY